MEVQIEGSNKVASYIVTVLPSLIKQCGLHRSRAACWIKITKDIPDDALGITSYLEIADCYMVMINPPKSYRLQDLRTFTALLAHELVHVRQQVFGYWKLGHNKENLWMGRPVVNTTQYLDMPWEVDAFSKQELFMRRAMEIGCPIERLSI